MKKTSLHTIQQVKNYQNKQFLIAISGGLDSIVLSHLFLQNNLDFALAHCNFKLRGQESDEDQKFIENWAHQIDAKLYVNVCDLSNYPEKNTQIAARNARYEWFNKLLNTHKFDYIVIGHHLDDSIETFFINLQRASGLKGLTGINERENILRPLLNYTRKEIKNYALNNQLVWREDSSNASDKYKRNFIRHQIIPKFEEITPSFKQSMQKTMQFLQQSNAVINDWVNQKAEEIVSKKEREWHLNIEKLSSLTQTELFLHHFLSNFGFSDFDGINQLMTAQNGKTILSENYRLIKHQNELIITSNLPNKQQSFVITEQKVDYPIHFLMQKYAVNKIAFSKIKNASKNEVYLDYDLIKFPLSIRKWEAGDYFYPLGMKGKMKLSDYFINQKISLIEKEKIWLFCDAKNNIVWIAGQRPDNRYKITKNTKKILHIKTD